MSGVEVDPKCVEEWNKQKLKKAHKYVFYKMNDDFTKIVVEQVGSDDFDTFHKALPDKECRYATVDVPNPKSTAMGDKLIFLLWAPDTAPVKDKMVYASSKDILTKKLEGIAKVIQANDKSEATLAAVAEKLTF